jgi:hypothetical protein
MLDDFSHIVVQLPCDVYIVASYLSEMGAPQRFGNPVVSVSNIKYIMELKCLRLSEYTKVIKFRNFFFEKLGSIDISFMALKN